MMGKITNESIIELWRDGKLAGYEKHRLIDGEMIPVTSRRVDGRYSQRWIMHDQRRPWRPPVVKRKPWVLHPGKYLTEAEVQQVLAYLEPRATSRRGKVNLFLIQMLLGTGLRASELCRLRVCDTSLVLGKPLVWVKEGKGGRDRQVAISSTLASLIEGFVKKTRGPWCRGGSASGILASRCSLVRLASLSTAIRSTSVRPVSAGGPVFLRLPARICLAYLCDGPVPHQ